MRHLLLLSVLLLGATWAVAQNYPSQTTPSGTGGEMTVQGCLSNSGGNYMLTAKNGKSIRLTGDTAKLSEHVGHEVKITGTVSSATEAPSAKSDRGMAGEESGSAQPSLEVSSVKHVSKTCQSGGASY
jgi:hypothetical protein